MFTSLPPVIVAISALFWAIKSVIKGKWTYMKYELVATIIVVTFLFHPEILRYIMSAFACQEINENEYWLAADLNIR